MLPNKIEKIITIKEFLELIYHYNSDDVNITDHTLFRLSENQRKIFKEEVLKKYLIRHIPIMVGIQYNNNYAIFYQHEKNVLKIIIELQPLKINVITFFIINANQIPRL